MMLYELEGKWDDYVWHSAGFMSFAGNNVKKKIYIFHFGSTENLGMYTFLMLKADSTLDSLLQDIHVLILLPYHFPRKRSTLLLKYAEYMSWFSKLQS